MNTKERTERLDELSQIYSLGMHHYINAAICSENELLIRFFEQRAYERMMFVQQLQSQIKNINGNHLQLSLEETIAEWQNDCAFQKLEETLFITNDLVWFDKKAIYRVYTLLKDELPEEIASLITKQIMKIESGFVALEHLLNLFDFD